ncbi:adenosylcobinamide-GDP ribazoletransferase [Endozoicomonas numazuensis]|uniref:adenosylcobinamide-GDP ribazoletransferase n=1 Tax=Endozoicomonas numazuensis TaxID=1137799 RepID=UPI000689AA44|nr:adenosylcobinamide-GDP ribazoletransferase [Endozoicomonas numazuensis]
MDKDNTLSCNTNLVAHGRALTLAITFFTRFPTWQLKQIKDDDMGRALLYLPMAGLILGLFAVSVGWLLELVLMSWHGSLSMVHTILIGFITFTVLTLASGGLHLDGLADCADAWVGGMGDRDRTLEIMKDPTCGPMAVFILVVLLLLKAAAVVSLVMMSGWLVLILIPVLSRSAGMALFIFSDYVRPKGLGQAFADYSGRAQCKFVLFLSLCIPLLAAGNTLWLPALISLAFWVWLKRESTQRIGGFTGDVAGAVIELLEACLLVTAALFFQSSG